MPPQSIGDRVAHRRERDAAPRGPVRFPSGFLWGAATSAHQVEGGNVHNDWWRAEQQGRLPYPSDDACRHYERYEQDFDLARDWGHTAHRFSIEWSRVEPVEGSWDAGAIAHYRRVVAALRERGLEPVVTLHHFTNPAWFAERGGWLRADAPAQFARFVACIAAELGDVRYWLTLNEPTVYAKHAYVLGDWPPFVRGSWRKAARALRMMARAHARAYRVLHARGGDVRVGFAHSAPWIEPCDPGRAADRTAAWTRDLLLNRAFFALAGAGSARTPRSRRTLDFVGLNYYTRSVVRWRPRGAAALWGEECRDAHHARGPAGDIGWEMYPAGLTRTLLRFARLGLPILVTENGIATTDEALRSRFVDEHLAALAEAVAQGAPVIGYLYWSLLDNFEWSLGTGPRFGLAAVDYATQQRRARPAAERYAQVCRANALE